MLDKLSAAIDSMDEDGHKRRGFLVFLVVLLLMTCLTYFDFICGKRALVYVEVGADSYAQSVPFFLNAAYRFSHGIFSTWNPSQYLGTVTLESWNAEYVVSLFGFEGVLWGMLWCQIAKIVLAGIFCYLYTGWLDARWRTRFVISLGCAFCGRMLAISAWTAYTMEVTFAVMLLWAFERFFHDQHKFITFPLALALMLSILNLYGLILYSAVLFAYALCRFGYEGGTPHHNRPIHVAVLQLVGLYIAGVMLALPLLLPIVRVYATSSRVGSNITGSTGSSGMSLLQLLSLSDGTTVATELVNTFTTGGLGYLAKYVGPTSPLNAPYYYCGLLTIVATPLSLMGKDRRQRIWLLVPALFALLYCLFPGLRYLMNGFAVGNDDFRMSSFFVVLVIMYLGTLGLENLWERANTKTLIAVFGVALALLATSTAILYPDHVAKRPIALAGALLIVYAVILLVPRRTGRSAWVSLLVIVVPLELVFAGYRVVNNVPTITPEDFYNSFSNTSAQALEDAGVTVGEQRIDDQGGLLTSSMAGSYLSTKMYIGGAGINSQTTDFLASMGNDYVEQSGYSRYAYGVRSNVLNDLLGVGYLAIPNNHDGIAPAVPYGYGQISDQGDWYLYKNEYALPMLYGYTSSEAMSRSDFLSIDREDRPAAMLANVILPDSIAQDDNVTSATYESVLNSECTQLSSTAETLKPGGVINMGLPTEGRQEYLVFDMDLSATSTESGNLYINIPLYQNAGDATPVSQARYRTAAGNEHIRIVVADKGYEYACVTISDVNNTQDATVTNINVSSTSESYFDFYKQGYEARMSSNPTVTSYGNDHIEGTIDLDSDGYVVVPFSWEQSWHAYVDGEEQPAIVANLGFLGVRVPAGSHTVRFEYHDSERTIGLWCAGMSGCALAGCWIGLRVRNRKRRHEDQTAISNG